MLSEAEVNLWRGEMSKMREQIQLSFLSNGDRDTESRRNSLKIKILSLELRHEKVELFVGFKRRNGTVKCLEMLEKSSELRSLSCAFLTLTFYLRRLLLLQGDVFYTQNATSNFTTTISIKIVKLL